MGRAFARRPVGLAKHQGVFGTGLSLIGSIILHISRQDASRRLLTFMIGAKILCNLEHISCLMAWFLVPVGYGEEETKTFVFDHRCIGGDWRGVGA